MLLSIVVPMNNAKKFIANCLDSLLDQDILVINNGATDRSAEIAATYANQHENIILVN